MRLRDGIHEDVGVITYIDDNTVSTPFFTGEYCRYFIDLFEELGFAVDKNGNYDTLIHKASGGDEICSSFLDVVERAIEPEILKVFTPAIKSRLWHGYPVPFIKKFSGTGQTDLSLHNDNSLLTLFVKLNDDFEGCETIFPRQKWSMKDAKVGHMVIFPGVATHPHYTTELFSGVKYSLVARISILTPRTNEFDDIRDVTGSRDSV